MASLASNLTVCYGRTIIPPSGSHLPQPSFSMKPNYKKPTYRSQTAAGKSQFRQRRNIHASILSTDDQTSGETIRPQTYVDRYSIWGDSFSSFVYDIQIAEEYAKEIEPLKEEVRAKLLDKTKTELEKLHLIDILERLGISYHYEKKIDENLVNIFSHINGFEEKIQYNLYDSALLFRIFRQHGFDISSEIFRKFMDSNGTFKEHSNDPKGLLSLYEASFVRRHEDDILDEALSFTKLHLHNMSSQLSPGIKKQVEHALVLPLHRSYERTQAYYNINFYNEDESKDEKLLKFAKLDFNLLQMLHKQELSDLMRWWKPIITKFDFARDRIIECYYTALGQFYEPQYSIDRILATKALCFVSLIDDTFDVYGTLDELKLFTEAVERWNYDEIDQLSHTMKLVHETILNLYQEFDEALKPLGRSFAVDYWKQIAQEFVKAEYKEAKWILGGVIPSFEEYLQNACITITVYQMIPVFLFTSEFVTKGTYAWLGTNPKPVVASALQARLHDDIATYEDEKIVKGQLTTGIDSYMKQYGVSKSDTIAKYHEMIEDAWRDVNREFSRSSQIPMFVLKMILNYTRAVHIFFRNDLNHYVHVEDVLKLEMTALLMNPINI